MSALALISALLLTLSALIYVADYKIRPQTCKISTDLFRLITFTVEITTTPPTRECNDQDTD